MHAYQITETLTGRSGIVPANQLVILDYPVNPRPRYGYGKPPHSKLAEIINANRAAYADPPRLIEIGSGNSTKFARRAIADHGLRTRIESIDPAPRAEIDAICDRVIRSPLEELDPSFFAAVEPSDVVFFDGSHRALTNSDCVAFFLDVLPYLPPGVLVHLHDIFLPLDYPPDWSNRFYSEQYLLAAYLLGGHGGCEIVLPVSFIGSDPQLYAITPLWEELKSHGVPWGASFWMRTR
jgi:hypothetical protein